MASAKIPVVFILSAGHSGSTLLDLLLSAHPDMVGLGEAEKVGAKVVPPIPEHHCSCGKLFADCPFWREFVTREDNQAYFKQRVRHINQTKLDYFLGKKKYHFIKHEHGRVTPEEYIQNTEALYRYALQKSEAKVVVDSSKRPYRPQALVQYGAGVEPYLIHLVRDGRGVLWSFLKKYRKEYPDEEAFWIRHAISEWFMGNLKVELLRRRLKVRTRRILYSDLVRDPEGVVKRICADLGLDPEKWNPSFRDVPHHLLAGNLPTIASTEGIVSDESWKRDLPAGPRLRFNLMAGWLNAYYALRGSEL